MKACSIVNRVLSSIALGMYCIFWIVNWEFLKLMFENIGDFPWELWLIVIGLFIVLGLDVELDFTRGNRQFVSDAIVSGIGVIIYLFPSVDDLFRILRGGKSVIVISEILLIVHVAVSITGAVIYYSTVVSKATVRYQSLPPWRCVCGKVNEGIFEKCECGRTNPNAVVLKQYGADSWNCPWCGRFNANIVGVCACGITREQAFNYIAGYYTASNETGYEQTAQAAQANQTMQMQNVQTKQETQPMSVDTASQSVAAQSIQSIQAINPTWSAKDIATGKAGYSTAVVAKAEDGPRPIVRKQEQAWVSSASETDWADVGTTTTNEQVVANTATQAYGNVAAQTYSNASAQTYGNTYAQAYANTSAQANTNVANTNWANVEQRNAAIAQTLDKGQVIQNFKKLLDEGYITEEQFEAKRRELFG